MKFLVDAHLPVGLCALLMEAGHEAVHTSQLPHRNRTTDEVICELSTREQMVVISKDTDFYYSHVLHGRPFKLVLVRTGNLRARDLLDLFRLKLPALLEALTGNTLIELDRADVQIVV